MNEHNQSSDWKQSITAGCSDRNSTVIDNERRRLSDHHRQAATNFRALNISRGFSTLN